jgi:NADH dehydrogenase
VTAGTRRYRAVVVGAGFAGASLIQSLPPALRGPGKTLLVDSEKEWPFIPLLHEVAVGRIHPDSIRSDIPALCRGRCDFLEADVEDVEPEHHLLHTSAGLVEYEYLILAAGARPNPPPEEMADEFDLFGSLGDALRLRSRINEAWQASLRGEGGTLTVALVGGGATGVELAAEIAALFQYLRKRTPRSPRHEPRVVLLEAEDRLLGWLDPYFHEVALEELRKLGIEVRLGSQVTSADESGLSTGSERIPARIRVWAAGIHAAPLTESLRADTNPAGRVEVGEYLTPPGHPDIYMPGDAGVYTHPDHGPLPPTASVAVQEGPWISRDLERRIRGRKRSPFSYFDRGYVVSLGPEDAVAEAAGARLSGVKAQALYRSIFLYYLRGRRARLLTGADWSMERTIGRLGFDTNPPRRSSP